LKPHLIIDTVLRTTEKHYPFWGDVIKKGVSAPQSLNDRVDDIFKKYNLGYIVTSEYPPKERGWNNEERRAELNHIYRLILTEDKDLPPSLVKEIELVPGVREVKAGEVAAVPLPEISSQQAMYRKGMDPARKAIGLDYAHDFYTKGQPQIKVAVLDTGIDTNHPELRHCLVPGYDFVDIINGASQFLGDYLGYDEDPMDEVGHGTHVAGIIAGAGLQMPPGVVPECKIIPVRVLGAMKKGSAKVGAGLVDNINTGIKWAVDQGADVINMSLGIKHVGGGLPHERVVDYAKSKGTVIIAASGNDGTTEKYYPGSLKHVIAVGALNQEMNQVASYSTYGEQVDFVAPGTSIYSTYIGGDYAFSTGTSHASPFVAGAAAMLKSYAYQHGKKIKDRHIKYILKYSSDRIGREMKDPRYGFGQINLRDALNLLKYKINLN